MSLEDKLDGKETWPLNISPLKDQPRNWRRSFLEYMFEFMEKFRFFNLQMQFLTPTKSIHFKK